MEANDGINYMLKELEKQEKEQPVDTNIGEHF